MGDIDLFKLYSQRILALAADIPLTEPLPAELPRTRLRAPLCGSTIEVALDTQDGRITQFSQSLHACALGQASASIFARQVIGMNRAEVENLRDALAAMLLGGPVPEPPFQAYEALIAARDYPNRHGSILLAPNATLQALEGC